MAKLGAHSPGPCAQGGQHPTQNRCGFRVPGQLPVPVTQHTTGAVSASLTGAPAPGLAGLWQAPASPSEPSVFTPPGPATTSPFTSRPQEVVPCLGCLLMHVCVCLYVCAYVCVCVRAHAHVCMCVHARVYPCACVHVCACMYVYPCVCVPACMCVCRCVCNHSDAHSPSRVRVCTSKCRGRRKALLGVASRLTCFLLQHLL